MFSEMLKKAMQEKDMNLTALSAATGIGKSSISQYLSGKNEPPDKKKTTIALAMGLPADYFKKVQIQSDLSSSEVNLSVIVAAKLMGKSKEFVYQGLKDGVFLFCPKKWQQKLKPLQILLKRTEPPVMLLLLVKPGLMAVIRPTAE